MSRIALKVIPIVMSAGLMAGCSTMPEWTKPTTWVDGVTDSGKPAESAGQKAETTQVAKPVAASTPASGDPVIDPLAEEPAKPRIQQADTPTEFPNINTQPEPRQVVTTESQRREIRDALVADRDNAQHSADELRGGTAPAAPPPAPAAVKPATPAEEGEKKPDGQE
jgi:hypothetical protein